jgi:hypothetical protein
LDTWNKDRRFVVTRVLKPAKDRSQLSFLEGSDYEYFDIVTHTELPSEKWCYSMEEKMLILSEFSHNYHPSVVKMLAKFIRRGIRATWILDLITSYE